MTGTVENRKWFTEARTIRVAVDKFAVVKNALVAIASHLIVRYCQEMDTANINEWLRSAGTIDEPLCTASKGSFASR